MSFAQIGAHTQACKGFGYQVTRKKLVTLVTSGEGIRELYFFARRIAYISLYVFCTLIPPAHNIINRERRLRGAVDNDLPGVLQKVSGGAGPDPQDLTPSAVFFSLWHLCRQSNCLYLTQYLMPRITLGEIIPTSLAL